MNLDAEIARLSKELAPHAEALLPREDREMTALAKAIAERLVPTPAAPVAKADSTTEDRLAAKVAEELLKAQAPTREERWCELEGVDPTLAGIFDGRPDSDLRTALIKATESEGGRPTPGATAEMRKAYEAEGLNPAMAGLF